MTPYKLKSCRNTPKLFRWKWRESWESLNGGSFPQVASKLSFTSKGKLPVVSLPLDRAISSPVKQITCWSNVMLKSTDLDPHGQYKVGIRGVRVDKIGLGVLPGNRN